MSPSFKEYQGSSVLITGGLGFIGSNLARRLIEIGGIKVFIVDALLPGHGGNPHNIHDIRNQVTVYTANLRSLQLEPEDPRLREQKAEGCRTSLRSVPRYRDW